MSKPAVSVLMPSYNQSEYIALALHSLISQSFTDFEAIIVNDGSTDNTLDVIKQFPDPRIHCYTLEDNCGLSYASKYAYNKSKGGYITFLDSDDMWLPTKLVTQVEHLQQNPKLGANFIYSVVINENNDVIGQLDVDLKKHTRFKWLNKFFTELSPLYGTSVMVKRELVGSFFDDRYYNRQDVYWWIQLLLQAEIEILPQQLVALRRCSDGSNMSASQNLSSTLRSLVENQMLLRSFLSVTSLSQLIRIFPKLKNDVNLKELKALKDFKENEPTLIKFWLGMTALSTQLHTKAQAMMSGHRLFGLNLLYEIFENKKQRKFIEKQYNFKLKNLRELSGSFDIFNRADEINLIDCGDLGQNLNLTPTKVLAA